MNRLLIPTIVAAGLFGVAAAAKLDAITLKRAPAVGQKTTYDLKGTLNFQGQDIQITSKNQDLVTAVDADGSYTTESSESDLTINGMPGPTAPGPSKLVQKPSGEVTAFTPAEGAGADAIRLTNLTQLYFPDKPVSIGDTWSYEGKPNAKTGGVEFKADMKILSEEKIGAFDTVKIDEDAKELKGDAPSSIHTICWVNKADGTVVKADATVKDIVVGPGITASGTMNLTRTN